MGVVVTVQASTSQWNASVVNSRLIVGGGLSGADEMAWLTGQCGVTEVVSAAADLDDTALCVPDDVTFYHVKWQDDGTPKPLEDFRALLAHMVAREVACLSATGHLPIWYIHCAAGVNRGPLAATFRLAAYSGLSADDAFAIIKAARPQVGSFNQPAYRQCCLDALAALTGSADSKGNAGA